MNSFIRVKLVTFFLPFVMSPLYAADSVDINDIIDSGRYDELKEVIYSSNYSVNVIDRSSGSSYFDYAVESGDKRAAIILAEYNNERVDYLKLKRSQERLEALIISIKESKEEIDRLKREGLVENESKIKILTQLNKEKEEEANKLKSKLKSFYEGKKQEEISTTMKLSEIKQDINFYQSEITKLNDEVYSLKLHLADVVNELNYMKGKVIDANVGQHALNEIKSLIEPKIIISREGQ